MMRPTSSRLMHSTPSSALASSSKLLLQPSPACSKSKGLPLSERIQSHDQKMREGLNSSPHGPPSSSSSPFPSPLPSSKPLTARQLRAMKQAAERAEEEKYAVPPERRSMLRGGKVGGPFASFLRLKPSTRIWLSMGMAIVATAGLWVSDVLEEKYPPPLPAGTTQRQETTTGSQDAPSAQETIFTNRVESAQSYAEAEMNRRRRAILRERERRRMGKGLDMDRDTEGAADK